VSLGLLIAEAIASAAASHPEGCVCVVCRAAGGDHDAFAEIAVYVQGALSDDELRQVLFDARTSGH
jgi:hypothetical protein